MAQATMKIDAELIRDLLRLPHDCKVMPALINEGHCFRLHVDHPSIPDNATEVVALIRKVGFDLRFGGFQVTAVDEDDVSLA